MQNLTGEQDPRPGRSNTGSRTILMDRKEAGDTVATICVSVFGVFSLIFEKYLYFSK